MARRRLRRLLAVILAIQGVHLFEHVVQLVQVYAWHRPESRQLGLLGDALQFHGTAEWLHLGFNIALLTGILWIAPDVRAIVEDRRRVLAFLVLACGVETWHVIEHMAVTGNMLANGGGCPCPGILDRFVPEKILHFSYNALAFSGLAAVATPVIRRRRAVDPIAIPEPAWLAGHASPRSIAS